jgi:hypothetical protein
MPSVIADIIQEYTEGEYPGKKAAGQTLKGFAMSFFRQQPRIAVSAANEQERGLRGKCVVQSCCL